MNIAAEATMFGQRTPPMNFLNRLLNVFKITTVLLEAQKYLHEQNKFVQEYFGIDYPDVMELQKDLSLIFTNYHHAIFGPRPFTQSVISIAGIHIRDNNDPFPEVNNFINN